MTDEIRSASLWQLDEVFENFIEAGYFLISVLKMMFIDLLTTRESRVMNHFENQAEW